MARWPFCDLARGQLMEATRPTSPAAVAQGRLLTPSCPSRRSGSLSPILQGMFGGQAGSQWVQTLLGLLAFLCPKLTRQLEGEAGTMLC